MALHTGEAETRDGDYFGPTLNQVARLLAAGHGGQVLLSRQTAERLRASLHPAPNLRSLGEHRLRDLPYKAEIFQLALPGLPARFPPLNTLDVAFRRGMIRAATISGLVTMVFVALALFAAAQARRADQQRRLAEMRLYVSDMGLAHQAYLTGDLRRAATLVARHWPAPGEEDIRGFEWRYLWRLCKGDAVGTLRGHSGPFNSTRFSPDGTILAAGSFSYDGRGRDGELMLWDVASKREITCLERGKQSVGPAVFSPNGRLLAARSVDPWPHDVDVLKVWDLTSHRAVTLVQDVALGLVAFPVFSPDGKLFAAAVDRSARLWEVGSWREIATLRGSKLAPYSIQFSPDSRTLITVSRPEGVKAWKISAQRALTPVEGYPAPIQFRILPWRTGRDTVQLWDSSTRQIVGSVRHGGVQFMAVAPDGRTLAMVSWERGIKLWDIGAGREIPGPQRRGARIMDLAFSPGGKILALGATDGLIELWDVSAGREIATLRGHTEPVEPMSLSFSPDGQLLASGSDDRTVRLWRVAPRQTSELLRAPDGAASSLASPPDRSIQVSLESGLVRLWDTVTRRDIAALPIGREKQGRLPEAYSADGKLRAAVSHGILRLWDVASGQEVATLAGPRPYNGWHCIWCMAFSPDRRMIVAGLGDGILEMWDIRPGRPLVSLAAHASGVRGVAFAPSGNTMATAGDDGTVKLWNLATRQEILPLQSHTGEIRSIAFSADGNLLAAAGADGAVQVWQAPPLSEVDSQAARHRDSDSPAAR
jgi:WD40 repeat protein